MSTKLITKTSGKTDKKAVFKIEKDFFIGNVDQIKNELDDIVGENSSFRLEMKNMENFDLSAIQIIHALEKKYGEKFSYSLEVKDETKTILAHSGLDYILNRK